MISTDDKDLEERIDNLRTGYEGYASSLRLRNQTYLRLFSPDYDSKLGEHDQWGGTAQAKDVGKARSSFNITRAVVELWTALEAYPFPSIEWEKQFIPSVVPSLNPQEHERNEMARRAQKLVAVQISTLREQAIKRHIRLGRLERHYYRTILRKNLFGHSWLQVLPDEDRERFVFRSSFDPSTIYPTWAAWDQNELVSILVVTRRSARTLSEQYPEAVKMSKDGDFASDEGHYQPTALAQSDADRRYVWVEDLWLLDRKWEQQVKDSSEPIRSRVINATRINGKIVEKATYPGWRMIPFIPFENDNVRDRFGFSDVATVGPIQDSLNRFLSQQQDVIGGESRPKWKARSPQGPDRKYEFGDEGVLALDIDEDIEQLKATVDVFPTQVHGQQLMDLLSRATGLNDSVFGRIVASQNSGRALATAWRSVASRLVPRLQSDSDSLDRMTGFMLDIMELYDWDDSITLFRGNRDFKIKFPNQEPRDFLEVTSAAVNQYNAGLIDHIRAIEDIGIDSPDEMQERVRSDYTDTVLHPEKAQTYQLLKFQEQQMAFQAAQMGMEQQRLEAELQAQRNTPPGGAPGGANNAAMGAAAEQTRTAAAQQAAPTVGPGEGPQPATQSGQSGNATQTQSSSLVQNGRLVGNRITQKVNY